MRSTGCLSERAALRRTPLQRDVENSYLKLIGEDDSALSELQAHSLTYHIALAPHRESKAFTVQTLPPRELPQSGPPLAKTAGFSLHAGVAAEAHQRDTLERLCRYIAHQAL